MAEPTTPPSTPFRWDSDRDVDVRRHEVGDSWVNDHDDNPCFGCRHVGEKGLRLTFTRVSEDTVESRWTCDPAFAGWKTVVHGGIQATVLDEVMGCAAWVQYGGDSGVAVVTTELHTRFRRPCPTETELVVRGILERVDGKDHHVRGEIVAPDGTVVTEGRGVMRRIR